MAATSKSLKEYLKRYESSNNEDETKKKKKKKQRGSSKIEAMGVKVVDNDPVWQKPVKILGGDEDDEGVSSGEEERPLFDEDIEVKRMKRLELLRAQRPVGTISEDGSGWVNVPPPKGSESLETDLSPPWKGYSSRSPEPGMASRGSDLSPPRKGRKDVDEDLSPPRKSRNNVDEDLSPPRKRGNNVDEDLSPPRKNRNNVDADLSPPRKGRNNVSPPRKRENNVDKAQSPSRKKKQVSLGPSKEKLKSGLISGRDISEEISKTKRAELSRFEQMDPSETGQQAASVYRHKKTGERITEEEHLKSQKKLHEKPKEIKVEWGKGLAQKREAEAKLEKLEREKEKPFARTRDDPELDKMMKEAVRWGDPMAHLVKKNHSEPVLRNLGDSEKMMESGFIIPQEIPNHSWLKRGLDAAPNRYGIKPGRHWDGVDRSNGFEKGLFKRTNEKQATQTEAYLWSVADM